MQIGGNYAWGAGTPHLKFFGNLMLGCRGINRSKKYLKVNLRHLHQMFHVQFGVPSSISQY